MITEQDFVDMFETLFNELLTDVLSAIDDRSGSFSVFGNFRGLLSSTAIRNSVIDKFRSLIGLVYRDKGVNPSVYSDSHVAALSQNLEGFVERINVKIEDLAASLSSVPELRAKVEAMSEFSSAELWGATEFDSVKVMAETISAAKNGAKFKIWKTVEDERVRDHHVEMHDVRINVDAMFQTKDGPGLAPRAPTIAPEGRINCRCWLVYE